MRRRLSRLAGSAACVLATLGWGATRASAQGGLAEEGALNLLLPVGAHAVGMGQAVVAEQLGSEGVWWNPASLAGLTRREAAIHHFQSVVGRDNAITLLIPSALLGVLAASVNILNYGEQELVDPSQVVVGTILPRSLIYAATYATPIAGRVNAGVTYKIVQFRLDCSGLCGVPPSAGSTSALDFGAQYDLKALAPIVLGAALRNVGLRLQVRDRDQADPLPTRLQLGVLYRVQGIERRVADAQLRLTADLLGKPDKLQLSERSLRAGADLAWRRRAHVRGGYVTKRADEEGGPSLGLGLDTGALILDVARVFGGLSGENVQSPTYFSLRYLF